MLSKKRRTSVDAFLPHKLRIIRDQAKHKTKQWVWGPRIPLAKPFRSLLEHLWKLLACGLHAGNLENRMQSGFRKFKLILKQK